MRRVAIGGVAAAVACATVLALAGSSFHASLRTELAAAYRDAVILRAAAGPTTPCALGDRACARSGEPISASLAERIPQAVGPGRTAVLEMASGIVRQGGAEPRQAQVIGLDAAWLEAQQMALLHGRSFRAIGPSRGRGGQAARGFPPGRRRGSGHAAARGRSRGGGRRHRRRCVETARRATER